MSASLSAQVRALQTVVQCGSAHSFVKAGIATRKSEAELLLEQLQDALASLRQLENGHG